MRTAIVLGLAVAGAAGCGSEGREQTAPQSAVAEVLAPLKAPESPYFIIYYPPVDLAKRADTTKAARK